MSFLITICIGGHEFTKEVSKAVEASTAVYALVKAAKGTDFTDIKITRVEEGN